MNQDYLKSWTIMTNEMQKPFHAILELHANTLKNLGYLRPEELSNLHQPGDLLNRHLAFAMENSQNMLNYMQKSFQIFEHAFLSLSKEMRDNAGQFSRQIKIDIEGPASRKKPAGKKAVSAKSTKMASHKSPSKAKVASAKNDTKAKSKTAVSKSKPKSSVKKMSTAATKKAPVEKNKSENMRKISAQGKKKSASEKKVTAKAPKKTLMAKNMKTQGQKAATPEKKVASGPMPKTSASMLEPKMSFSANKMSESKLNIPPRSTNPTENKMMRSESISNRFQDKNPFHK